MLSLKHLVWIRSNILITSLQLLSFPSSLFPLPPHPPRKRRESIVLLIHPSTHSITYAPLSFYFPTLRLLLSQPFSISLINRSSLHFLLLFFFFHSHYTGIVSTKIESHFRSLRFQKIMKTEIFLYPFQNPFCLLKYEM